jgi:quinone-modifying oxidoreductase, subunit QmoC
MAIRANPKLIDELEPYGAEDVVKCYHCGNCSAVCPFSEAPYVFPRRPMRYLQMGLEEKLKGDLQPWLCYYCGECSDQCPREAEPGETMMSLRRWLTSRYDWTGISRLFYKSWRYELGAIVLVAVLTVIGFLVYGFSQGSIDSYDGAGAFLPSSTIHIFDWALAIVLLALLLSNAARMWWFTMGRDKTLKVSLGTYVSKAYLLVVHFFTQKRYSQCERKSPWLFHLLLMLSYVTMLILIMFFLVEMASGPSVDWRVHAFGLPAAAGLIVASIVFLRRRITKSSAPYKHSHESDWIFLVLLLVVAATGVTQFLLHRAGADVAANVTYITHLAFVVPMLGLEVPFSKWSHLAYRPLAMYFAEVRAASLEKAEREAAAGGELQAA